MVESPDGAYAYSLKINEETLELNYKISFHGQEIIRDSELGFVFVDKIPLKEKTSIVNIETKKVKSSWKPVYGEKNEYPNVYNEVFIEFSENKRFALRIRAYDEGIAFRYEFAKGEGPVNILQEKTAFTVAPEAKAWVSLRAQSEIIKMPVSAIDTAMERPMLLQFSDSLFIAIGEAALVDYARMKLTNTEPGSGQLESQLDGNVLMDTPFNTPWRFVMAAQQPGQLIEHNYLLLNLNQPNRIKNTSWIKPGKVIREVTLTTKGGMACVDFAFRHNLQYVEFDAGWYGNEYSDSSDATTVTVDPNRSKGPLDLQKVIKYAETKGIGIILYVNRRALESQLDDVLFLLGSWGVKGIKYGFVNVGSQEWTSWLHDAVRKAADHQLMIDIHDEYRPTGYSRTYPNLMTQEGIRGDEESPDNAMVLNTLFTRMIAGAGDHTNCYFAPRVHETMGSHASQMAKAVCIYSPWQFLYWYDRPPGSALEVGGAGGSNQYILELPELNFYDRLPTVWDDTKVIDGYPGEFAIIARKSGSKWFIGALNGPESRKILIPFDFLNADTKYTASIYYDLSDATSSTKVGIEKVPVVKGDRVERLVNAMNGLVVIVEETQ